MVISRNNSSVGKASDQNAIERVISCGRWGRPKMISLVNEVSRRIGR